MAPFIYFLPRVTREQLFPQRQLARSVLQVEAACLSEVLGDLSSQDDFACGEVQKGPGNLSGVTLVALPNDRALRFEVAYRESQQAWTPAGDGQNLWVGFVASQPPSPADLIRKKAHAGYPLALKDETRWTVPVIRRPEICTRWGMSETELPRDFVYDSDGALKEELQERYRAVWEATGEVADLFFTSDGVLKENPACSISWAVGKCIDVLGVNYRYGRHEQSALRLVNSENWASILGCAVDQPSVMEIADKLEEAQKKRHDQPGLSTQSSETGKADATSDIDQAVANCS